jgi:hypothetical protein
MNSTSSIQHNSTTTKVFWLNKWEMLEDQKLRSYITYKWTCLIDGKVGSHLDGIKVSIKHMMFTIKKFTMANFAIEN